MSIHVKISEEAQQKLTAQKRVSTISSLLVSALVLLLVGLLLGLVLLPSISKDTEQIVTYKAVVEEAEKPQEQKTRTKVQKKPTAPPMANNRVISSSSPSAVSIPVPDVSTETEVLDYGDQADFGGGWGEEMALDAGGGTTFFQQEVKAERVVFVIDYSGSMRSIGRDVLMREELAKSVKGLSVGTKYQLIFFAGPAWLASDELTLTNDAKGIVTITDIEGKEIPVTNKKEYADRKIPWLDATEDQIKASVERIENMPLIYGTYWKTPIEMALEMKPKPQVIFFMTDGLTGGNMAEMVADLASKAKRGGTVINTVSLMEPAAEEFMAGLAFPSGGQFTLVEKGGKSVLMEDPNKPKAEE